MNAKRFTALSEALPSGAKGRGRSSKEGRTGKKAVIGYFSPALNQKLKMLAAERETTMQAMLGEGIDLVFAKYGIDPLNER